MIPGHSRVFADAAAALSTARSRLAYFQKDARKHARHAVKVLLKFKLLERQRFSNKDLREWALGTAYLEIVRQRWFAELTAEAWLVQLLAELEASGALRRAGDFIMNSD